MARSRACSSIPMLAHFHKVCSFVTDDRRAFVGCQDFWRILRPHRQRAIASCSRLLVEARKNGRKNAMIPKKHISRLICERVLAHCACRGQCRGVWSPATSYQFGLIMPHGGRGGG